MRKTIDIVYRRYRPMDHKPAFWVGEMGFKTEDNAVDYICRDCDDTLEEIRVVEHDGILIRRYVYSTELGFYNPEEDV
jgi:hypothetical protein